MIIFSYTIKFHHFSLFRFSVRSVPGHCVGPVLPGGELLSGAGNQLRGPAVGRDPGRQPGGGGEGVSGEGGRGKEREGGRQTEPLSRQRRRYDH